MSTTFLHTADWQLGKPYARVEDPAKRTLLQNERFNAVERLGKFARDNNAEFILVAGDLFDSPTASNSVVSRACSLIGATGLPVYVIPGNHDHGGPESIWNNAFFQRERLSLAPNLHLLLTPEPLEVENAILLPCPLLRRHESSDTTQWLRQFKLSEVNQTSKPRIVIAHGSVIQFGPTFSDEEDTNAVNLIDLQRLPEGEFDYIALGDWHGAKEVHSFAWYSGTPELDRFVKGNDHQPGHVLVVTATRGKTPQIRMEKTSKIGWHATDFCFAQDEDIGLLESKLNELLGTRAGADVLQLALDGALGIEACTRLEKILESAESRLLRLKLKNNITVAPSDQELKRLTQRAEDPLIAQVARRLMQMASSQDKQSSAAQIALRELYASTLSL